MGDENAVGHETIGYFVERRSIPDHLAGDSGQLDDLRGDRPLRMVAGDLVPRAERGVRWLLERFPDNAVIFFAGNHEAYGCDERRTVEKAIQAAAGT